MDLKKLEDAATEQFTKNGLVGWTFRLADTKRRLGVCKYRRGVRLRWIATPTPSSSWGRTTGQWINFPNHPCRYNPCCPSD